uniref:Uncharacterized protein n=1 Tax=Glossina brevipalpis TaxID=37001 RepID=A0A1A9WXE7_9MUSC
MIIVNWLHMQFCHVPADICICSLSYKLATHHYALHAPELVAQCGDVMTPELISGSVEDSNDYAIYIYIDIFVWFLSLLLFPIQLYLYIRIDLSTYLFPLALLHGYNGNQKNYIQLKRDACVKSKDNT